jgi:hypothetical protein
MDITDRVIDQIVVICKEKGFAVLPQLAAFMAKGIIMDNSLGFNVNMELSATQLGELVNIAVYKLAQNDSPQLETVKMQVAIMSAKEQITLEAKKLNQSQGFKSEQLIQEITDKRDEAQVFGDIVLYILHETKLLDSTNDQIEKETMNALESVIPRNYIGSFISQTPQEKKNQLQDLWKIVWGIRLFNKATKKGGAGIEQITDKVPQSISVVNGVITKELDENDRVCVDYVSVLTSGTIKDDNLSNRLKAELTNRRQYSAFLQELLNFSKDLHTKVIELELFYKSHTKEVKKIVEESNSVPKSTIYPMFILLADNWMEYEQVKENLKEVQQIFQFLKTYKNSFRSQLSPKMTQAVKSKKNADSRSVTPAVDVPVVQEAKQEAKTETKENGETAHKEEQVQLDEEKKEDDQEIKTIDDEPAVLEPVSRKNEVTEVMDDAVIHGHGPLTLYTPNEDISPEFNGFCTVSFVNSDNLLCPGDRDLGFGLYNNRYYGFVDRNAAKTFATNPEGFITAAFEKASHAPELLVLLSLQQFMPQSIMLQSGDNGGGKTMPAIKMDGGCQTELHAVESHKDYKYEFSEWKLRARALKIADLRNKVTHSTQTVNSHFRRDNESQVYLLKEKSTNTAHEKGTNPQKQIRYVKGLRGAPTSKMSVVNMTFDQ